MTDNSIAQAATYDFGGWKKKTVVFISSQSLSMFGSMLVQYAITWHITLTTQSGWLLTAFTLAGFLPQIVITLFAGVWADRYNRRKLIIGADLLTAGSTLVLAVLYLLGYRELWLLFVVAAIRSVGYGIQAPAVNALLPQIVPGDQLMKVNSINSTLQPFIMILSPVAAGALMGVAQLEAIFFVDVVTAALAVGLLLGLRVPTHQRSAAAEAASGYFGELRAGLAYIARSRPILTLFVFFAFTFFLITPVAFLSPLLVARSYGEEVWRLTANEVTFFVGSIIGGGALTLWGGFKNRFRTLGLAAIVWAVLFSGLGITRDFTVYLVLMFLSGLPMPFFNAPTVTLLQELVPTDMQGRVFSVQQMIGSTVMPVGMLVFGPLADAVSVETLLVGASALMAIPGLWIFFSREPEAAAASAAAEAEGMAREYDLQPGD